MPEAVIVSAARSPITSTLRAFSAQAINIEPSPMKAHRNRAVWPIPSREKLPGSAFMTPPSAGSCATLS